MDDGFVVSGGTESLELKAGPLVEIPDPEGTEPWAGLFLVDVAALLAYLLVACPGRSPAGGVLLGIEADWLESAESR